MAFARRPSTARSALTATHRSNWLIAGFLGLLVTSLAVVLILPITNVTSALQQQETDQKVTAVTSQLQSQMEMYLQSLYGSRAFMTAQPNATRLQWQKFYLNSGISKRLPGVGLMAYVRRVPSNQKTAFITETRNDHTLTPDGYPDFTINPDVTKAEHLVVDYIEPFDLSSQKKSFGFDYSSDTVRRAAYEKARDTNLPVMTDPTKSVNNAETTVLVIILPVYNPTLPQLTPDQRRTAFLGFTALGIRTKDFFDQTFSETLDENMAVQVYDGPETTDEHRLYDSAKQLKVLGVTTRNHISTETRTITVADRTWTLQFQVVQPDQNTPFIPSLRARIAILVLSNSICGAIVWWLATRQRSRKS